MADAEHGIAALDASIQRRRQPDEVLDDSWQPVSNVSNVSAPNGDFCAWRRPAAISAPLLPVKQFEADVLLPASIRDWILDESERMPCPPDYIAATAIVALGSIIGARCAIRPKTRDDWTIVPNLWGAVVGLPSSKKSPGIAAGLRHLDRLIANAIDTHRDAVKVFEAERLVHSARTEAIEARLRRAAKNADEGDPDAIGAEYRLHVSHEPTLPKLRRYKTSDTTVEKLGELLRDNPTGLLVQRDELVGLLATWDRDGREGDRAFFLEAWNGNQRFDTDRIARGTISIPNLCVSVFGGIQPDKLTAYLERSANALANDGLLQRFQILVYPDTQPWEWRDLSPNEIARDQAFAVFKALAEFDPVAWGADPVGLASKFPTFRFDDSAQQVYIEWASDLHHSRIPLALNPLLEQHLSKYDKLMPAIALVLHLTDCATSGRRGAVTREAVLQAAAWCDYLEAHARRCYGLLADSGLRAAQTLAERLRDRKLEDGFTARDVCRKEWQHLKSDEDVRAALEWLEEEGWLRSEEVGGTGPGTGRRTRRYLINPRVKTAQSTRGRHV